MAWFVALVWSSPSSLKVHNSFHMCCTSFLLQQIFFFSRAQQSVHIDLCILSAKLPSPFPARKTPPDPAQHACHSRLSFNAKQDLKFYLPCRHGVTGPEIRWRQEKQF